MRDGALVSDAHLVAGTLGDDWAALVTFQFFQSLLCEKRKFDLETKKRREGFDSDERKQHYQEIVILKLGSAC